MIRNFSSTYTNYAAKFYSGKGVITFLISCLLLIEIDSFVNNARSYSLISKPKSFDYENSLINSRNHHLTVHYGIPKLFRWLVELYPVVTSSVGEGLSGQIPVDNFYLDMNGIIHSCTHSNNDKLIALNEREMFQKIFKYTDRLYKLVRPTRMMFLAIDGVAPRAKMNQQRARRFRSSKEREVLISEYIAKEGKMPEGESFDSNCITPGTDFLHRLGIAFRRWIAYKMETDPFWMNGAEIVFSGGDVPGEGEHKIMDMIRREKAEDPQYFPGKYKHCMYGLDADLIMLSLVSHEPFFLLLREKINRRKQVKDVMNYVPEDFELLEVSLLRQMLKQHFRQMGMKMNELAATRTASTTSAASAGKEAPSDDSTTTTSSTGSAGYTSLRKVPEFDLERVIDDFVFMCIFIGNDFMPNLPHLDIADGSLNLMMNVYRDMLPEKLGGYLTNKGAIHLNRLELFVQEVGRREPLYFQQRAVDEKDTGYSDENYKEHYYQTKFGISASDTAAVRSLVQSYVEGMYWVLQYYHSGCGSWVWFFPQLYAPLATDLINLSSLNITFDKGRPFTPLLQLLSVLPPQSAAFLPPSYNNIMTSPLSSLAPFYPTDFEVDANGKKNAWECIVRIPFIDEKELVRTVSEIDHRKLLTLHERERNILGREHRFTPPNFSKGIDKGLDPSNSNRNSNRNSDGSPSGRWGNALDDMIPGRQGGSNRYKPYSNRQGGAGGGSQGGNRPNSQNSNSWQSSNKNSNR